MNVMEGRTDAQIAAARNAAQARQAIAIKIKKLAPNVEEDAQAQVILHLAEAYSHLAVEPPRVRA